MDHRKVKQLIKLFPGNLDVKNFRISIKNHVQTAKKYQNFIKESCPNSSKEKLITFHDC